MITNKQPYFFVTAQTDVRVIALNYIENKQKLDTDYQFLHFLLLSYKHGSLLCYVWCSG